MTLLHVLTGPAWSAGLPTTPDNSFLHLCTPEQLDFVVARHFGQRAGLVVLHLDPTQLIDVRWEASEPDMAPFPHLYGPLDPGAVTQVETLR